MVRAQASGGLLIHGCGVRGDPVPRSSGCEVTGCHAQPETCGLSLSKRKPVPSYGVRAHDESRRPGS
jgi:hypothetical protein